MDVYAIVWERFAANSISCCWFAGSRFSGIWGKAIVNEAISNARQMSDSQSGCRITRISHSGSGIGVGWGSAPAPVRTKPVRDCEK